VKSAEMGAVERGWGRVVTRKGVSH
jgi:hypothetical protein